MQKGEQKEIHWRKQAISPSLRVMTDRPLYLNAIRKSPAKPKKFWRGYILASEVFPDEGNDAFIIGNVMRHKIVSASVSIDTQPFSFRQFFGFR